MTDKLLPLEERFLAVCAEVDSLRTQLAEARKDDCTWADYGDDNMPGTYEGKCGIVWTFTEGGIADNDCIYCPRCGGKIIDQAIEQEAPSLCTAEEAAELALSLGYYKHWVEDNCYEIAEIINADRAKR